MIDLSPYLTGECKSWPNPCSDEERARMIEAAGLRWTGPASAYDVRLPCCQPSVDGTLPIVDTIGVN